MPSGTALCEAAGQRADVLTLNLSFDADAEKLAFAAMVHDRMLEEIYPEPVSIFTWSFLNSIVRTKPFLLQVATSFCACQIQGRLPCAFVECSQNLLTPLT